MTFQEWADSLFLRASDVDDSPESPVIKPWRCCVCEQLMYGIERVKYRNYPTSKHTPAGLFISVLYPHVCHACWEMHNALERAPSGYWQRLAMTDDRKKKQLGAGGDYLFT